MPKIIANGRVYVCEYVCEYETWSGVDGRWFLGQAYFQSSTQLKIFWTDDKGKDFLNLYTLPPGTTSSYPPNVWPAAEQILL